MYSGYIHKAMIHITGWRPEERGPSCNDIWSLSHLSADPNMTADYLRLSVRKAPYHVTAQSRFAMNKYYEYDTLSRVI